MTFIDDNQKIENEYMSKSILDQNLDSELKRIRLLDFGFLSFILIFPAIVYFGNTGILISIPLLIISVVLVILSRNKNRYSAFLSQSFELSEASYLEIKKEILKTIKNNKIFCLTGIVFFVLGIFSIIFELNIWEESLQWFINNQPFLAATNIFSIVVGIYIIIISSIKQKPYKQLAAKLGINTRT